METTTSDNEITDVMACALTFLFHSQSPLHSSSSSNHSGGEEKKMEMAEGSALAFVENDLSAAGIAACCEEHLRTLYDAKFEQRWHELLGIYSQWGRMPLGMAKTEIDWTVFEMGVERLKLKEFETKGTTRRRAVANIINNNKNKPTQALSVWDYITSAAQMKAWLEAHQREEDNDRNGDGGGVEQATDVDYLLRPMHQWRWQHIVHWLETHRHVQLHRFSSIFWEWRLSGLELQALTPARLSFIVESCSLVRSSQFSVSDMDAFCVEIKRCRALTMVTYQYTVYHQVVEALSRAGDTRCHSIVEVLRCLRPAVSEGPKAMWKVEAVFLSKIDNLLAVLVCRRTLQRVCAYYHPRLILDPSQPQPQPQVSIATALRQQVKRPSLARTESDWQEKVNIGTLQSDWLDKVADAVCSREGCNRCNGCVHRFDRVYLWVLLLVVVALTVGCVSMHVWMSWRSLDETDVIVDWLLAAVSDRAIHGLERTFFAPQLIVSLLVGAVYDGELQLTELFGDTSDIHTNAAYDALLTQYSHITASRHSVASVAVYDVGSNRMVGADYALGEHSVYVFDELVGACLVTYGFNATTRQRTPTQVRSPVCDFEPTSRAWYKLARIGKFSWTEPYLFANGDDGTVGMTLVTRVEHAGFDTIWLVEFTLASLQDEIQTLLLDRFPGSVIYLLTPNGSVIASDSNEFHLPDIDCAVCHADNQLIADTVPLVHEHVSAGPASTLRQYRLDTGSSERNVILHTLKTVFFEGDVSLNRTEYGTATVAVVYDQTYLAEIKLAQSLAAALTVVAIVFYVAGVCAMGYALERAQLHELEKKNHLSRLAAAQAKTSGRVKYLIDDGGHFFVLEHATLISCSLWYLLVVFVLSFVIWTSTLSTLDTNMSIFLDEEFMIVQDQAEHILHTAQSVSDAIADKLQRSTDYQRMLVQDASLNTSFDIFLSTLMNAFIDSDGRYLSHHIYVATPSGKFVGVREEDEDGEAEEGNTNRLRLTLRDASTEFEYVHYRLSDDERQREKVYDPLFRSSAYDPRCRPWYINAARYMLPQSDAGAAFGEIANYFAFYQEWYRALDDPYLCQEAIDEFIAMYQMEETQLRIAIIDNNLNYTGVAIGAAADDIAYLMTYNSHTQFASSSVYGLTAANTVEIDNQLLCVVSVDFTLNDLSNFLRATNDDDYSGQEWFAWIYHDGRVDSSGYAMVAASNDQVYQSTSADSSSSSDSTAIPYQAVEHVNDTIRVASLILNQLESKHEGAYLPINATDRSQAINVPMDVPDLLSGKLQSFPQKNNSEVEVAWIIAKAINITGWRNIMRDDNKLMVLTFGGILAIVYMLSGDLVVSSIKKRAAKKREEDKWILPAENKSEQVRRYGAIMAEIQEIVDGAATAQWVQIHDADGSANDQRSLLLTTAKSVAFLTAASNAYIESAAHNDGEDLVLFLNSLQYLHHEQAARVLTFMKHRYWNWFVGLIIAAHMFLSLYLPVTPAALVAADTTSDRLTAVFAVQWLCIVIEVLDLCFVLAARYIEFGLLPSNETLVKLKRVKHGFGHPFVSQIQQKSPAWLVLFGTSKWHTVQTHILCVLLITVNAITMQCLQIAVFTYYIPVVPIFLIVRSNKIRRSSKQFMSAVYLGADALGSYMSLILIVALMSFSVFGGIINQDESVDTFVNAFRSLITTFVFMSTGENYNEIVYPAANQQTDGWLAEVDGTVAVFNLAFFVIASLVGLYFFIPLIIHRFEHAYDYFRTLKSSRLEITKRNSIIAAFILLDMNDDATVSSNEFSRFRNLSNVKYDEDEDDEQKVSSSSSSADEDDIELYNFTRRLMKETNGKLKYKRAYRTSRLQSWLECNLFRRSKNRSYALILILLPSIYIAFLRGLGGIDTQTVDDSLSFMFFVNFVEINLRWYAFGWRRFVALEVYSSPPLVNEAMHRFLERRSLDREGVDALTDVEPVKLSRRDREWSKSHLAPVKPATFSERQTLSILHKMEQRLIWFGFVGIVCTFVWSEYLEGYRFLFIQIYLFRLFTLIESNQKSVVFIFRIIGQFVSLLGFLGIFVFFWAQIGCTLFAFKTEFVITDIFATDANADFDSLASAIVTLIQLLIGEGWHEIMYLNVIATQIEYSLYFIVYIIMVTLVISNIFIGLFLSEIDRLSGDQEDDEILNQYISDAHQTTSFRKKAIDAKKKLITKLDSLRHELSKTEQRIAKINELLSAQMKSNV